MLRMNVRFLAILILVCIVVILILVDAQPGNFSFDLYFLFYLLKPFFFLSFSFFFLKDGCTAGRCEDEKQGTFPDIQDTKADIFVNHALHEVLTAEGKEWEKVGESS